jgi:large subunit ribosomal protein L6
MSRIGRRPIEVPKDVTVSLADGVLSVAGDNGELTRAMPDSVSVTVGDDQITVEPSSDDRHDQAMWGTMASHIKNMITGVTEGYDKTLTYKGIGYQASVSGDQLHLEMGYSHDVDLEIPDSASVETGGDSITVSGPDKEVVGQFAASIRAVREPEPYKGAGIQYEDETIRRKEGKTAV